jgi:hypothetical protein
VKDEREERTKGATKRDTFAKKRGIGHGILNWRTILK